VLSAQLSKFGRCWLAGLVEEGESIPLSAQLSRFGPCWSQDESTARTRGEWSLGTGRRSERQEHRVRVARAQPVCAARDVHDGWV